MSESPQPDGAPNGRPADPAIGSVRLGFVGMGMMGAGMAANLVRAGHRLTVWNRSPAKAEPLADLGAEVAASPAAVAAASDVVFVCVSDTPDVEAVLFGPDGVARGCSAGDLVVDHSTVSPAATRDWAQRLAGDGVAFVDAPVSGGSEGAQKGTLSVMVGGARDDVDRVRQLLDPVAATVTHVGPVGAGQTCKLVNQVLVVVSMLGVAEALVLAQAGGLDPALAVTATAGGAGGSWMLANRGPQVAARDFRPGFTIDLQQKDLRLVLEAADELGVPAIATSVVHQLYRTLQADGLGDEGNHALVKALEKLAGVTVSSPPPA